MFIYLLILVLMFGEGTNAPRVRTFWTPPAGTCGCRIVHGREQCAVCHLDNNL